MCDACASGARLLRFQDGELCYPCWWSWGAFRRWGFTSGTRRVWAYREFLLVRRAQLEESRRRHAA